MTPAEKKEPDVITSSEAVILWALLWLTAVAGCLSVGFAYGAARGFAAFAAVVGVQAFVWLVYLAARARERRKG